MHLFGFEILDVEAMESDVCHCWHSGGRSHLMDLKGTPTFSREGEFYWCTNMRA